MKDNALKIFVYDAISINEEYRDFVPRRRERTRTIGLPSQVGAAINTFLSWVPALARAPGMVSYRLVFSSCPV